MIENNDVSKYKKFVQVMAMTISVIYFLFALLYAIQINLNENKKLKEFDDLLSYVEGVNSSLNGGGFFDDDDAEEDNEVSTTPLFSDGRTAFITAYTQTICANSYYISSKNSTITISNVGGIQATTQIDSQVTAIRFNETTFFEQAISKLSEADDAAKAFENTIRERADAGAKRLKVDSETLYRYQTRNVSVDANGNYTADFSGSTKEVVKPRQYPMLIENLYLIDENTLKEEDVKYFYIKYEKGVPKYYYVQVVLSGDDYVWNYKNYIWACSGSTTEPAFSYSTINLVIDSQGYISGLISIDNYNITVQSGALVAKSVCKATQNMVFAKINETIEYDVSEFYE